MKELYGKADAVLSLFLLASLIIASWSLPQGHFQKRNWTPQAMLYLKGAQGRRFISEERQQKALYNGLQQEIGNLNVNPLTLSEALALFLSSLQDLKDEEDDGKAQEKPSYIAEGLLSW